jgi:adenylate cyclase
MAEERTQRRLAAILAADVVGYSRLMQRDEAGTLSALKTRRKDILQPLVSRHQGRIVKLMGDGVLLEFASAVAAVECAVEVQQAMEAANAGMPEDRRIVLRVGISLGDVMVEGSDLYGDGVNVAARLEALAKPGSVFVSQAIFSNVRGKTKVTFEDLGEQSLKNMAEPIRVYKVSAAASGEIETTRPGQPSKLSIAVLPFVNMSGDPEQEYFSDGITEDIITDLSKVSTLNILSRNTVFAFKGKTVDVGQIARQLKVGHVLEGSVRKAGGRVRITAQLIDTVRDSHVWAERYDRELSDIFALQDEISQAIVAALKIRLLPEEKKAIETRSTHNPEAYEQYLLGRDYQLRLSTRNLEIAARFYRRALEIDPDYARAWAMLAISQAFLYLRGRSEESGLPAAQKALALDPSLAEAHAAKGRVLAFTGRVDEGLAALEEALRLDPDSYDVRLALAYTCHRLDRYQAAIEHYERAAQLLPSDFYCLSLATMSYMALNRHDDADSAWRRALERIEKEIALRPDNAGALVHGAIALAYLGEKERAKQWASRAQAIEPDDFMDQYNLACALTLMGEVERSLDMLESCTPKLQPDLVNWIKRDSDLILLHEHARYKALIARGEARLAAAQGEQAAKAG